MKIVNALGKGVYPATGIGIVRRGAARSVGVEHAIDGLATVRCVIMDIGEISVTIDATMDVRAGHVIDYMEPVRRVIMDIGEVSVKNNATQVARV